MGPEGKWEPDSIKAALQLARDSGLRKTRQKKPLNLVGKLNQLHFIPLFNAKNADFANIFSFPSVGNDILCWR